MNKHYQQNTSNWTGSDSLRTLFFALTRDCAGLDTDKGKIEYLRDIGILSPVVKTVEQPPHYREPRAGFPDFEYALKEAEEYAMKGEATYIVADLHPYGLRFRLLTQAGFHAQSKDGWNHGVILLRRVYRIPTTKGYHPVSEIHGLVLQIE